MNLLCLETSMGKCSVALVCGDKVSYKESSQSSMQSEELFPIILELAAENNINLTELDIVACTIGPGSFTGIRIGIAAARGMKKAAQSIKLIGISNLELLARAVKDKVGEGYSQIVSLIDAHKDEFYLQKFDKEINQLSDIRIINRGQLADEIREDVLVVGNIEIENIHLNHVDIDARLVAKIAKDVVDNSKYQGNIYPLYIKNPSIHLK